MSSRLELIASFASQGRGVADIGTDHAILPIILRRNGYSGYIVAGDINEGPLKKAERGLLEAEVDDVELKLCNGLEGIDGSGKSAQYRRLCARFDEMGMAYHHIVFPRYDQESSALIRMYLNGAFGAHPSDVNAYAASTFFAVDRYASYRTDWGEIYENGGLILSDRYTTSNAIHQGSKLPEAELPAFFDWLYDLEYGKMGLPRPDLVLYLDVDLPTSLKRMQHRQEKHNTKADIHEQDVAYLENCLRIGRLAAAHYGWTVVPFMKDGAERELEEKHEEIFSIIRSAL